ncbi:MAG: hypothetical protein FWC60_08130 [Firmicutes bacterium]|nr:hypothetical protein [Bacillota bacterium]
MSKDEFLDEKIIELINQAEKSSAATQTPASNVIELRPQRTIYSGIKDSDGQLIEFTACPFIENKIAMMVPKDFKEMDQASAKIKYPMEQRPGTILTDHTGTINILLSYMDETITNQDTERIRDQMLTVMCRVNPGIKPQRAGQEIIAGKNIAYVEFTHSAIDGKLYNLMYFMELDGKALMGLFNCLTKKIKYWQQPALEMMRSIRLLDSSDQTNPNN